MLDRHADLKVARSIYRAHIEQYPGRLIMLCDQTRVLARSDRPQTFRIEGQPRNGVHAERARNLQL